MTKVGIYAILRINGTVFDDAVSHSILQALLLVIGLITSVYGVIGAIGAACRLCERTIAKRASSVYAPCSIETALQGACMLLEDI